MRGSRDGRRAVLRASAASAARTSRMPWANASVASWTAACEPAVHRSA